MYLLVEPIACEGHLGEACGSSSKSSKSEKIPPRSELGSFPQGGKRNPNPEPKPKLLGLDIYRWGGVFHVNGWGPNSSACPSKHRETKLSRGILPGYPGEF